MENNSKIKRQRWELLLRVERLLEGPMVFLGFVWLVLLVVELIWQLTPALEIITIVIWILFIIDFIIKLILAPSKSVYLKKSWLTLLSLIIPALRVFRIVRVFRFVRGIRGLKLVKVVGSLNRGMKSLAFALRRRGLKYVILLTLVVIFGGGAGMFAFEKGYGLTSYGEALWWTAMLITSIGSEYWPQTGEGKALCFLLSVYGFCVFGYITATLASFFVGRDAEEKDAPVAGTDDIVQLRMEIEKLTKAVTDLKNTLPQNQQSQ